jgi:sugar-specific transcriptional regulator TrmB
VLPKSEAGPRVFSADVPRGLVNELREKWQAYYADTRAEVQRRHAERIHNVDPTAIATRARHMMAEARKNGKTVSSREAVLRATDELTADFETTLRRKYGDLVVDVLGIPQFADVSDKKRLA